MNERMGTVFQALQDGSLILGIITILYTQCSLIDCEFSSTTIKKRKEPFSEKNFQGWLWNYMNQQKNISQVN